MGKFFKVIKKGRYVFFTEALNDEPGGRGPCLMDTVINSFMAPIESDPTGLLWHCLCCYGLVHVVMVPSMYDGNAW